MARGGGSGSFNMTRALFGEGEDEGVLAKRDDDRRPQSNTGIGAVRTWTGHSFRPRSKRRWFIAAGALFLLWLYRYGLPGLWGGERSEETMSRFHPGGSNRGYPPPRPQTNMPHQNIAISKQERLDEKRPPPKPKGSKITAAAEKHYYEGDIIFRKLSASLQGTQRTMGFRRVNQNILFAASNLKSLGTLLPLACDMAKWQKNYVHVAVFGRSEMSWEEILKINGISTEECKAYWHDARPNWAAYSSDLRAEASVASGLEHIFGFLHPQAVIMDDSSLEDLWFTRQLRVKAEKFEWPIIELPEGNSDRLGWLARLDTQAVRAIHSTTVDVLIQAPKAESGNLIRLLKSLLEADYEGLTPPKLTIELPPDVDPFLTWYLSVLKWPPEAPGRPTPRSQLNIRHRIPDQTVTPEESSVRFLESFYPVNDNSHVLVLNPNAELSPLWYQWTMYHLLQYRHSPRFNAMSHFVMGLSLDVPTTQLDGKTAFEAPAVNVLGASAMEKTRARVKDLTAPFLWQAPDSNAVVYFGDKWGELHDFLRHRLRKQKESKATPKKLIGDHMPAWTEYFLEIMRARGWSLVYPASSKSLKGMVTLHKELYAIPEEFAEKHRKSKQPKEDDEETTPSQGELSSHPEDWKLKSERPRSTSTQPLHAILPFDGEDPPLSLLPQLLYDGSVLDATDTDDTAKKAAEKFRNTIGGCEEKEGKIRKIKPGSAADLFCWGDEDEKEWEKVPEVKEKDSQDSLAFAEGGGKGKGIDLD